MNLQVLPHAHEESFFHIINYLDTKEIFILSAVCKELHAALAERCTSLAKESLNNNSQSLEQSTETNIYTALANMPTYVEDNRSFVAAARMTSGYALGTIYEKEGNLWMWQVGRDI